MEDDDMTDIPFFTSEKIADGSYKIKNGFTSGFDTLAYLVEGSNYALLIDTILGFGDLNAYCRTLTDKPVKVVNTHAHWDHIGGNFHFDACYMPVRDIKYFQECIGYSKEDIFEAARNSAKDEYKDMLVLDENFAGTHPIKVFPIDDGDVFDLGDRRIEVVAVGGHTPGSIVLIDDKTRICYSGDACNGNTLIEFDNSLPVSIYLENLKRLKTFASRFDMMYGGHGIFDSSIIDEGIETASRVVAGTDDKCKDTGITGNIICYAAKRNEDGNGRADGKRFNMSYDPSRITGEDLRKQVI